MSPAQPRLSGSFWAMFFFDIADSVDLKKARALAEAGTTIAAAAFRQPLPAWAGFENPPVTGEARIALRTNANWKVFEYGVLSIYWDVPFTGTWNELVKEAYHLQEAQTAACRDAEQAAHALVSRMAGALQGPYERWLNEDYLVFHIPDLAGPDGLRLDAESVIAEHAGAIAQLVRGEPSPLAPRERDEVLSARMSCYPSDLIVAGWAAAFLYEPRQPAQVTIQLIEHANAQLLEFRHYDAVLDGLLKQLYRVVDSHSGGLLRRWKLARQAERLNAIRLDVMELTERSQHSLRLFGDMYYARASRMVAQRIGVDDYRSQVAAKLHTAGELYNFLIEQFHQQRTFVLELLVVIILVVELADILIRRQ
jgi:hypothetical protein